jgi:hypothetical protein
MIEEAHRKKTIGDTSGVNNKLAGFISGYIQAASLKSWRIPVLLKRMCSF